MYKSYLIVKWSIKHLICTSYALPVTPTHANDAWHCVKGTCLWLSATMGVQLLPVTRRRGPLLTHYKYNTYSTTQHITDTVPVQCTHWYTNEWEAIPIHVYVLYVCLPFVFRLSLHVHVFVCTCVYSMTTRVHLWCTCRQGWNSYTATSQTWEAKHLLHTSYALPVTPTHANDAWHCVKGTCLSCGAECQPW